MTGAIPSSRCTARAVDSWTRTLMTSMQLPRWSTDHIDRSVHVDAEQFDRLRSEYLSRGAVLALPHMGSWDLAGAWVARRGFSPSSVAENLPRAQFELFCRTREQLGMRIRGHERHGLVNLLRDDIAEGRTVCLVADRDLTGRGVPIVWQTPDGPVPATMPAGPALLATTTGAALVGVCCHYDSTTTMHIDLSDPLDLGPRPLRDQVRRTTQQLADWFAPHIRRHVVDWHMMQPFVPGVRA